jgi:hypothetical protein
MTYGLPTWMQGLYKYHKQWLCGRYGGSHQESFYFKLLQVIFQVHPDTVPQVTKGGKFMIS